MSAQAVSPANGVPWHRPFLDLWENRNLIHSLVVTNEKSTFHRSSLGLLWKYIEPAFFIFTYYLFIVVIKHSAGMQLIAVIMSGLMVYEWTRKTVLTSCTILPTYRSLAITTSVPLICLIAVGFYQNTKSTEPLWLMAILAIGVGYHWPDIYLLGVPFLLLLLGFSLFPLCIIVAYVGSYFHDLHRVLEMVFRIAIFVSPVLFEASTVPARLHWVVAFNPIAYFVESLRDLLWRDRFPDLTTTLAMLVCGLVLWRIALLILQRIGRHVVKVL